MVEPPTKASTPVRIGTVSILLRFIASTSSIKFSVVTSLFWAGRRATRRMLSPVQPTQGFCTDPLVQFVHPVCSVQVGCLHISTEPRSFDVARPCHRGSGIHMCVDTTDLKYSHDAKISYIPRKVDQFQRRQSGKRLSTKEKLCDTFPYAPWRFSFC